MSNNNIQGIKIRLNSLTKTHHNYINRVIDHEDKFRITKSLSLRYPKYIEIQKKQE